MKQEKESLSLIQNEVMNRIFSIRQKKVMTDADVAELYGVETKRINEIDFGRVDHFAVENFDRKMVNQEQGSA